MRRVAGGDGMVLARFGERACLLLVNDGGKKTNNQQNLFVAYVVPGNDGFLQRQIPGCRSRFC